MLAQLITGAAEQLRSYWLPPVSTGDPALVAYFGRPLTTSGTVVSPYTALNYSAVFAAVQAIAGAVGSLPLFLYDRLPDGGKDKATRDPLYRILHDEFNPEMTAMIARETLTGHMLTWGNAYAEIEWSQGGYPLALWPITPDRVQPYRRTPRSPLVYRVINSSGDEVDIARDDMIHIPGLGFDGNIGYSVVRLARESIGLGLATEKYGASFFGKGGIPGIVAQHPERLSDAAHARLKASLQEALMPGNANNLLLVEEGIKVEKVGIPPDDAQFLQTREFQVTEIARWFNIPPHKLRDLTHATFSNIEQQNIEFVTDTLRPWLVRWEQELMRKLTRGRNKVIEHLTDGLLRGDVGARNQAYSIGIQWGWLCADDVRERENMNPLPDGEGQTFLRPLNMAPVGEELPAPASPAPPAVSTQAGKDGSTPEPSPPKRFDPTSATAATLAVRQAGVIAAERALVVEIVGRMVRREAAAIRKAWPGLDPAARLVWARQFYDRHAPLFAEALLPILRAHAAQMGDGAEPRARAAALVARAVAESLEQLRGVKLEIDLEAVLDQWEVERPVQLADQLMRESLTRALTDGGADDGR